jgi:adenine-specific DNA-methyltransferase
MDQSLLVDPRVSPIEKEIESLYHRHFSVQRRDQKLAIQRRINDLREQLGNILAESLMAPAKAQHVADWDPFDPQASSDFFDPFWMFGIFAGNKTTKEIATLSGNFSAIVEDELTASTTESEGFDIVIGNPPYIQIQKFPTKQKAIWENQGFKTYAATADIYCLFYERGAQLLKEGGSLVYITSNKWMRAGYGEKLRRYLSEEVDTESVLDFGMAQNFGAATTYTCITRFYHQAPDNRIRSCYVTDDRAAMTDPAVYFESNAVTQPNLSSEPWVVLSKERQQIKSMVEAQGIPLKQWDVHIYRGVLTGLNDAFYITSKQRKDFRKEDPASDNFIVPLLRGRNVERYGTSWDETWMISTFPSLNLSESDLPKPIRRHLEEYLPKLKQTGETFINKEGKKEKTRKKTENEWFETQDSIGYHEHFKEAKIIYPNMTKFLPFYFDTGEGFFTNDKGFIINSDSEPLEWIVAFLNSHLFRACFRDNFPELMGNTYEVRKIFVELLPIKKPSPCETEAFRSLVPLIQLAKKHEQLSEYQFLEDLIDACVMECYFRDHMAERDLLFLDVIAPDLEEYNPEHTETEQQEFLSQFVSKLNAPSSIIRNRLLRITTDSPDLLAIIKQEGKV